MTSWPFLCDHCDAYVLILTLYSADKRKEPINITMIDVPRTSLLFWMQDISVAFEQP